jgi:hypothetical protein
MLHHSAKERHVCHMPTRCMHQRFALTWCVAHAGKHKAGIAQENTFLQNITFDVNPGEVFVAPQGLLHYNHNIDCTPNVFLQTFSNADPGNALNVIGALAAFNDAGGDTKAAMIASGADSIKASPQMAFALDQACLKRCHFPTTGAKDDGLNGLPNEFRRLFGLDPVGGRKHGNYD